MNIEQLPYEELVNEVRYAKELNKKYNKWIESLNKDNHRLNNIIKEVREYIEKEYIYIQHETYNKLIEILDKGE